MTFLRNPRYLIKKPECSGYVAFTRTISKANILLTLYFWFSERRDGKFRRNRSPPSSRSFVRGTRKTNSKLYILQAECLKSRWRRRNDPYDVNKKGEITNGFQ